MKDKNSRATSIAKSLGTATSTRAIVIAFLGANPLSAVAAQQAAANQPPAQTDPLKNLNSDDQISPANSGPTTNTPSPINPQATKTPGGSTELPTADTGGQVTPDGETDIENRTAAPTNDIVVTGFRAAVANAIAEKRRSDQIVESVSAEDIGKLPDNSIAESIARLPGVTAQRVDGRDQVISVRGFAPDFSTTLLNGREQVTTNDNRSVEFDQYPSELLGQVVVYKTPSGLIPTFGARA